MFGRDGVLMNDSAKKKVSNSKYTEDWIPVKAIENGMIVLDNKMRVSGVKIRPRNIFILDQGTQDGVIIALYAYFLYAVCLSQIIYAEFLLYHHQKQ